MDALNVSGLQTLVLNNTLKIVPIASVLKRNLQGNMPYFIMKDIRENISN